MVAFWPCAFSTSSMSLASVDSVASLVTRMSRPPCSLSVPAKSGSPGFLLDGQRFAGDGSLVHAADALDDDAVDGNAFAGADDDAVADDELFDFDQHGVGAAFAERGFGPQFHQRGDGGAAAFDAPFPASVLRKRKEEEEHRALEGVVDVGGAERGEDHEQVDIDRAGEKRADAFDGAAPAARKVGGEKELEF